MSQHFIFLKLRIIVKPKQLNKFLLVWILSHKTLKDYTDFSHFFKLMSY